MRVLYVSAKALHPKLVSELQRRFDAQELRRGDDPAAFSDAEVFVTSAGIGIDAATIDALPNLKLIAGFGVGYDQVDLDAAEKRGIAVTNTPDVLNECVADLAVGLMIDTLRAIGAADRYLRRGEWGKTPLPLSTKVSGRRVGILGMGRIGEAIAQRLEGFSCEIRYHNRNEKPDMAYGYEPTPEALATWCDVLIVATPGGSSTEHLVDEKVLKALGRNGFLINIARGSVIDESALVDALVKHRIAGAGLDVFADEPNVPNALFDLENVVLTPHIASSTHETREAMADVVLHNIDALAHNKPLPTRVN